MICLLIKALKGNNQSTASAHSAEGANVPAVEGTKSLEHQDMSAPPPRTMSPFTKTPATAHRRPPPH